MPFDLKFKFKKQKTCLVQKYKPQKFLDREGVKQKKGYAVLYKRVSSYFKTQEKTPNETSWLVGDRLDHLSWNPCESECGAGKFHACSRPYFCDEFRTNAGDRYIAIKIKVADLYEWDNPTYPHKIAFKSGIVLYECDRHGKELKQC